MENKRFLRSGPLQAEYCNPKDLAERDCKGGLSWISALYCVVLICLVLIEKVRNGKDAMNLARLLMDLYLVQLAAEASTHNFKTECAWLHKAS